MRKRLAAGSAARLAERQARAAPAASLPPHELVLYLRTALHMTQAQLARRAGIPQSHLAKLESGKVDAQLGTWRKVLAALFCETIVVPKLARPLEEILDERVRRKARENVSRVSGTMALEEQLPDDAALRSMVKTEEARLRARLSPEIWSE